MSKRQERARQFVADVRAGASDESLRAKYGLSERKFFLYKASALDIIAKERAEELRAKRKINAHQLLADIKSGMNDDALMAKYELTARELQSVLRQIIEAGLATALDLSSRLAVTKSQVREAFIEMGKAIRELD
jgi:uncharacterized protein (DUF433 family)